MGAAVVGIFFLLKISVHRESGQRSLDRETGWYSGLAPVVQRDVVGTIKCVRG
jgi:hypothetical protein